MKLYTLICNYCDHRWKTFYRKDLEYSCPKCSDKSLSAIADSDVYGYDSDMPKPDAWVKRSGK